MSQPLLTLRPPANVDWIQGFPGIPSSSQYDRPHAAVKGTVEVRPSQTLKAKWLRIELRKVETLPGGAGVFFDYVGQSPVTLWQAQDEWGYLESSDFPFEIRIPESVPPSLVLEKGSGIRYELVATVCSKGKRGLLRKDATMTQSSTTQIIIDKHELHSTWPIYSQPNSKQVQQDAVELIVTRSHTCYGPGDHLSVFATVKSDDLSTCVLRTLEFVLRETVVFRAGPQGHSKKNGPQIRIGGVGEQRINANVALYGGTQYRAELGCIIPPAHSTATVNTARHIDVSYVVHVKAILDNGKMLSVELPVTLSNWPRQVSTDAIRRIGPAPNLSLQTELPYTTQVPESTQSSVVHPAVSSLPHGDPSASDNWNEPRSASLPGRGRSIAASVDLPLIDRPSYHISPQPALAPEPAFGPASTSSNGSGRPLTGGSNSNGKKIDLLAGEEPTVSTLSPSISHSSHTRYQHGRRPSAPSSPTPIAQQALPPVRESRVIHHWSTAEDEKRALYEQATKAVSRTQSRIQQDIVTTNHPSLHGRAQSASVSAHRFEPPRRVTSMDDINRSPAVAAAPVVDAAVLYQRALANMPQPSRSSSTANRPEPSTSPTPAVLSSQLAQGDSFPSAGEEKAALAYREARRAVERHGTQAVPDGPIAYDALFPRNSPNTSPPRTKSPSHSLQDSPTSLSLAVQPTIEHSSSSGSSEVSRTSIPTGLKYQFAFDPSVPEKERIRRAFEARDAAAAAAGISVPPMTVVSVDQPSSSAQLPHEPATMLSHSSAEDSFGSPHVRTSSYSSRRPPPLPPTLRGSPNILTAAEEKALLRAQYEAEESTHRRSPSPPFIIKPSNSIIHAEDRPISSRPPTRPHTAASAVESRDPEIKRGKMRETGSSTTPPPLLPRPPREYIQETVRRDTQSQEELARLLAGHSSRVLDAPPLPPKVPLLP